MLTHWPTPEGFYHPHLTCLGLTVLICKMEDLRRTSDLPSKSRSPQATWPQPVSRKQECRPDYFSCSFLTGGRGKTAIIMEGSPRLSTLSQPTITHTRLSKVSGVHVHRLKSPAVSVWAQDLAASSLMLQKRTLVQINVGALASTPVSPTS